MQDRTCIICGEPLGYRKKKICGKPECFKAKDAANARATRRRWYGPPAPCPECGGPVRYSGVGTQKKFCSDACKRRSYGRVVNRSVVPLPVERRECVVCRVSFETHRRNQIYCSSECYKVGNPQRPIRDLPASRACDDCGSIFEPRRYDQRFCSKNCQVRLHGRERMNRRRTGMAQSYLDREIFDRDKWRCHLCGKKIKKTVPRTHPMGATIDHLVPLSLGGADEPANVAAAHMSCNVKKHVGAADDQLRFI